MKKVTAREIWNWINNRMLRSMVNEVCSSSITVSTHCTERRCRRRRRRFVSFLCIQHVEYAKPWTLIILIRLNAILKSDRKQTYIERVRERKGRAFIYIKNGKTFRSDNISIEHTEKLMFKTFVCREKLMRLAFLCAYFYLCVCGEEKGNTCSFNKLDKIRRKSDRI